MRSIAEKVNPKIAEWKLESRRCQLVLKRTFKELFKLKGRFEGQSLVPLERQLDGVYMVENSDLEFEWRHGRSGLSSEEKLALGKFLTELRSYFQTQKRNLLMENAQFENAKSDWCDEGERT